jgi:hypothetical protein
MVLLGRENDEKLYDDEKFRKRVGDHLKQMMRSHLLNV